jgi:hypothetical protein
MVNGAVIARHGPAMPLLNPNAHQFYSKINVERAVTTTHGGSNNLMLLAM